MDDKQERLAKALRENLKRRKAHGRTETVVPANDGPCGREDAPAEGKD